MTILLLLKDACFGPQDIQAMSTGNSEDICKTLNPADEAKSERELLAKKIIALCDRANAMPRSCVTAC